MKKSYAVITGASSGIGMAFARQLAAEGYRLVLIARRENRLQALAEELNKSGTESMIITADLSEKEACYRLMQQLEPVPVGILINNAGFGDCGSFLETDADKEMQMIDVNVKAMHLLMKLMLRRMEKQEGGYILNVASSAGLLPAGPYMATYYATKAYMARRVSMSGLVASVISISPATGKHVFANRIRQECIKVRSSGTRNVTSAAI